MSTPSQAEVRRMIAAAGTIVVKVGSSSLTQPSGHLDPDKLDALAAALAQVRLMGGRVVLVSSGAIAAGFGPLGFDSRPVDVATQQATAAVGQGLLMARYETAFGRFGIRVGQILITAEDTIRATQYRNVERTLDRLLDLGVVPIINENDSLASNEIRFGDNDRLSALVANLVRAEALVLLTDVDALYTAPPSQPGSRRVEYVPNVIDALGDIQVSGSGSKVGTGGMVTKLEAARVAAVSGIPTVLTCASNAGPAMMIRWAPCSHRLRPAAPHAVCGSASPPTRAARLWSMRVPARRFAAGVPRCWRPARSKYMAIFPPAIRSGSMPKAVNTWPEASPASIPKKFRRCSGVTPPNSSVSSAPSTPTHWFIATISCSCD